MNGNIEQRSRKFKKIPTRTLPSSLTQELYSWFMRLPLKWNFNLIPVHAVKSPMAYSTFLQLFVTF